MSLLEAAKNGDVDQVKQLLANALDVPKQRSPFNHRLFFAALCALHRMESRLSNSMVQKILECAFMQPAREMNLISAARKGQTAELQAKIHLNSLAELQLDINSQVDENGYTAVECAASNRNNEVLQLLLEYRGDPNKADKRGKTAVHWAVQYGNNEVLQMLLQYRGDPNKADKKGISATYSAAYIFTHPSCEALELLKAAGGFQ